MKQIHPYYSAFLGLYVGETIKTLIATRAIKATKYVTTKLIVRAVRTAYGKKIKTGNIEITLTIGKPNYIEREFIKSCQKSSEPFPIKKIQLKFQSKGR